MSALNVLNFVNQAPNKPIASEIYGRYYNSAAFKPVSGWQYLTNAPVAVANDTVPIFNAVVSGTPNGNQISFNQSSGLIYLPKTGRYTFNVLAQLIANLNNGLVWRFAVYSSPAWPAANTTAKTYGTDSGNASALAGNTPASLSTTPFATSGAENALTYSGNFPAGTYIALMLYCGASSATQAGASALSFSTGGSLYFEAKLDYTLS